MTEKNKCTIYIRNEQVKESDSGRTSKEQAKNDNDNSPNNTSINHQDNNVGKKEKL